MRHVALLAAIVVLLSAVAPGVAAATAVQPPAAATAPHSASIAAAPGPVPALAVGTPRTNFTLALREDGSARWTVETAIPLEDDADREAFREYADAYVDGDVGGGPSIDLFRNAAARASEATGREMAVGQVNRTATLRDGSGRLALRFTWSGFLAPGEEGEIVLGDAFTTPGNGTWFGSLGASQRLVIVPPENYEVSDVSDGFRRSISDRRIVVEGPQTFDAGDIGIAYSPTAVRSFPIGWVVGGGAVLLVVVAVVAYRRGGLGRDDLSVPGVGAGEGGASAESRASADGDGPATVGSVDHDPDPVGRRSGPGSPADPDADSGAVAADAGSTAAAVADEGEGDTEEDLELLSDEERVERLLDRNGGRMRQGDIVSGTGWSDAKVSQLLSAMAEAGRIEKLRLGRENLISLAEDGDDGDDDAADR